MEEEVFIHNQLEASDNAVRATGPNRAIMVEKVARAIYAMERRSWGFSDDDGNFEADFAEARDFNLDRARAAIAALRSPTEAMLQPACDKHTPGQSMGPNWHTKIDDGEECPHFKARRRIWASMIDEALK